MSMECQPALRPGQSGRKCLTPHALSCLTSGFRNRARFDTVRPMFRQEKNKKHNPYAVWQSREYRLFSTGWLALVMAGQIETIAVGIHVYAKTADPLALGWVGLARALPVILLSIAGGQLADRFNRRMVMILTQALGVIAVAGLAALAYYEAGVHWFYVFLLLGATSQALGSPARSAILPQLVPVHLFSNAVTWNSSLFQVGTMLGPVIGGLLLGVHDYTPPAFLLALLLRLGCLAAIVLLQVKDTAQKVQDVSLRSVLAGARFVRDNKIILATITLDLFAMLLGGAVYLLPLYVKDILHVGGLGLGLLRSAEAIGAITMAMTIAHLPPIKHAGRAMLWAVAGFGAATVMFGLSHWFWLSMVAMVLIGACDNISVIVRHTLVQVLTPDHMRGRVSAVNNIFIVSSNDLGGFESGATARLFGAMASGFGWADPGLASRVAGAVASVVFGGIGAVGAVIGCARRWPQVLSLGSLGDIKPADEAVALEKAAEEESLK
ncbi:MAG: MFS transporter [bacterium]